MKQLVKIIFFFTFSLNIYAQTPNELKSYLPDMEGWNISEKIEVFSPDNLFDRINGAAPLFIENNFREMTSLEYTKGDDYITIQAYRHASPEDAFGMYTSERSPDLTFYPFAGEAQGDDNGIFFFAGNIYVKMWSSSAESVGNIMQVIARTLAHKIDTDAGYPPIAKLFPIDGKIDHSETYVTSSYLGHEFLKSVYTAKYDKENNSFQAFIIDGKTKDGARDILEKYFTFTKQPLNLIKEGELTIADRYNGDIPTVWKEQYIIGIFSENGQMPSDIDDFLDSIIEKL